MPDKKPPTSIISNTLCKICDYVYLGNLGNASNLADTNPHNIQHVLSLGAQPNRVDNLEYSHIFIEDCGDGDIDTLLREAIAIVVQSVQDQKNILVHCDMGISRSATVIIGYLMYNKYGTLNECTDIVYSKRPIIEPKLLFGLWLESYEKEILN